MTKAEFTSKFKIGDKIINKSWCDGFLNILFMGDRRFFASNSIGDEADWPYDKAPWVPYKAPEPVWDWKVDYVWGKDKVAPHEVFLFVKTGLICYDRVDYVSVNYGGCTTKLIKDSYTPTTEPNNYKDYGLGWHLGEED